MKLSIEKVLNMSIFTRKGFVEYNSESMTPYWVYIRYYFFGIRFYSGLIATYDNKYIAILAADRLGRIYAEVL